MEVENWIVNKIEGVSEPSSGITKQVWVGSRVERRSINRIDALLIKALKLV